MGLTLRTLRINYFGKSQSLQSTTKRALSDKDDKPTRTAFKKVSKITLIPNSTKGDITHKGQEISP